MEGCSRVVSSGIRTDRGVEGADGLARWLSSTGRGRERPKEPTRGPEPGLLTDEPLTAGRATHARRIFRRGVHGVTGVVDLSENIWVHRGGSLSAPARVYELLGTAVVRAFVFSLG